MRSVSGWVVVGVLWVGVMWIGSAAASQNYQTMERLLGWSVDGDRWVTVVEDSSEPEVERLRVNRSGKEAIEYCNDEGSEMEHGGGTPCEADKNLGIELERVDLAGHKKLAEHKLIRLEPAMRHAFELFYSLEHDRLRKAACVKSLEIVPRFPIPPTEVKADHCLIKVIGGFVHPKGERALVKIEMEWDETDDGLTTYNEITYTLVNL